MNLSKLRKAYPDSWLLEYMERCKNGDEIVGNELKLMHKIILMHLTEPTKIFPDGITFELDDAHKRTRFIESKCKHFEAPFAGKPFILMLEQKAYIEAFYSFKIYDDEVGRRVRLFQERLRLCGRKGGKALALDTDIPTPKGWRKMGSLAVGDTVFDENGRPTKILVTSDTFIGHDCYRVTFEDGEEIIADREHIWQVMTKKSRAAFGRECKRKNGKYKAEYREARGYFNVTTESMLDDFVHTRADGKGREYKYRVPMNGPLNYPEKHLPVHPYVLGVWLGDGDSDNTRITCSEEDFDEMREHIERCGHHTKRCYRGEGKTDAIGVDMGIPYNGKRNLNKLREQLREIGVFKNKHIPDIYLRASVEQRMELLKGLMDTDGYSDERGHCEFAQSDYALMMQFSELLSSLGIKHNVLTKEIKQDGKVYVAYRTMFYTDKRRGCFKLKRKHDRLKERLSDRMLNKSITNIERVPSTPTKCIGVDSPSQLFLAGRKMTATHNTPFEAAMDLADFFCGQTGTKILCSSNDHEQAALLFDAIDAMREESPTLERVTRRNNKGIFFGNRKQKKSKGKFSRQNKGSIRKISAKTGSKEGRNIAIGSVDEVHELKDNSSIMPIKQALSTQDEPIFSEITTEGFTEGYLDERLIEARQVLKGELERWRWLIWLHTQDSEAEIWQDEKSWVKSNPGLGVVKKWSYLRQMVDEARTDSAKRAYVLAKDFNIKQSGGAAWLQEAEIINTDTFSLEDFRGSYYIGGHDFAETTDLTASKLLLMKPDNPTIYFWSHYWIPEEKLKLSPDDANYEEWAKDGYLTIVKGGSVDSSLVADWQWELYQEYGLIPFKDGYDNRFAKDYLTKHEEYFGKDSEAVNVPQEAKALSNPMRRLESDLRKKLVNYNNRYGDYWCFRNTGIEINNAEQIKPKKLKTTGRIDGTAAAVNCYAILDWYRSGYMSLIGGA